MNSVTWTIILSGLAPTIAVIVNALLGHFGRAQLHSQNLVLIQQNTEIHFLVNNRLLIALRINVEFAEALAMADPTNKLLAKRLKQARQALAALQVAPDPDKP